MSILVNLNNFKEKLKQYEVTLVAVSKTKPNEAILEAYQAGHRIFGENKVQEMTDKAAQLPKDIEWHMIGHLQRNKVKYITDFVSLIHGVDSLKLLKEINKQAKKANRCIDCLLQMHIAEEDSKFGLSKEELLELLQHDEFVQMRNVRIRGLMGMATFTENQDQVRKEFRGLKQTFELTKEHPHVQSESFNILSMGMSGDYEIALQEGSTMVRIGSAIFGKRDYNK